MDIRHKRMKSSNHPGQPRVHWPHEEQGDEVEAARASLTSGTSMPGQPERSERRGVRNAPLRLIAESELEGTCHGWDGCTAFHLANGEIWQQSVFRSRKLHLVSPAVRVWQMGIHCWLEVEGTGEILPVKHSGYQPSNDYGDGYQYSAGQSISPG